MCRGGSPSNLRGVISRAFEESGGSEGLILHFDMRCHHVKVEGVVGPEGLVLML